MTSLPDPAATRARLSSLATTLDELTQRIVDLADVYARSPDESVGRDLYDVERSLGTASRKLASVLRKLR